MARYRLRYQATDLELQPGEFAVGRSSSCNLALDDALVSRRHAVFHVDASGVSVEDLGSRNGVLVNGERVEGRQSLRHLDRVTIGSQEMVLIELGRNRRGAASTSACQGCGSVPQGNESFCRMCGTNLRPYRTLAGQTVELQMPMGATATRSGEPVEEATRQQSLALLAAIADKALALKRFDEAERLLASHLDSILANAKTKPPPSENLVRDATRYALQLAEGLQKARWIDWVFDVNAAAQVVLTSADVERLHQLVRKASYSDPKALRRYIAAIAPKRDRMGAAERFVLQRLEGLERVITA